jgi:hypothetical protein
MEHGQVNVDMKTINHISCILWVILVAPWIGVLTENNGKHMKADRMITENPNMWTTNTSESKYFIGDEIKAVGTSRLYRFPVRAKNQQHKARITNVSQPSSGVIDVCALNSGNRNARIRLTYPQSTQRLQQNKNLQCKETEKEFRCLKLSSVATNPVSVRHRRL